MAEVGTVYPEGKAEGEGEGEGEGAEGAIVGPPLPRRCCPRP